VLQPRLRQFRVQLSQVTVRGREQGHTFMVKYIGFPLLVLLLTGCGGRSEVGEVTLQWQPFENIQASFPSAPKPLFLYISQGGCDHCEHMDSAVFSRPEVARYVNTNFTPVKVDIYMDTPLKVRDSMLTEPEFRKLLSIRGIPAYYFFDTDGRVIGVLDSEMELLTFKRMLVFIREGHFFRTPWERFMKMPQAGEEAIDKAF